MIQQQLDPRFTSDANAEYQVVFVDGVSNDQIGVLPETIKNPFGLDLRKFAPATGHIDLTGLYDLISKTVNWKQELEGVGEIDRVKVVKDWNPKLFSTASDLEQITIRLISRAPAKMSADQSQFKQRRSAWDREYASASHPGHTITIYSQPLDHQIEIVCWAKDSTRADERALWLERLLVDYSWIFISQGIDKWYFENRLSDIVIVQNDTAYHQRPLRFFTRLRELQAEFEPQLKKLSFTSSIA
jgi:hypothetical protein